jgi:hypothetical protein
MLDFLRSLAAQGLDQFAELSRCHVVMIGSVFPDDRSQGTRAHTVDVFDGEQTVRGNFAGADPKLPHSVLEEKAGAPDVAGCTHAHNEVVSATWLKFEGFIEGSYPVDFHKRHAESLGRGPYGLFRDVTVVLLNVLQHFNELIRLTATSFQYLTERLGRHFDLLNSRDYLIICQIRDRINDISTE